MKYSKMPLCSVITCKCGSAGYDGAAEGIVFHGFPSNEEVRAKWVDMTGRDLSWVPTSKDFVCSRHFRDNDYFIKRSGKRYLKTSAIPCEYVVYRHLYPDEVLAPEENNEAEVKVVRNEAVLDDDPDVQIIEDDDVVEVEISTEPGTSRGNPSTVRSHADSTGIATIFDISEGGTSDWERFQPERFFGQRLPASIFDDQNSQEVGSSGLDERYRRERESSINPYPPMDLYPNMQLLPPPRTPEPVAIDISDRNREAVENLPLPPSPMVDSHLGRNKLENIRKILSRRKSNKAIAAALDEVKEAETRKIQLQSGEMNDYEKAAAIIAIQTRQILKLTLKYKRMKKIFKRISAVIREAD